VNCRRPLPPWRRCVDQACRYNGLRTARQSTPRCNCLSS
jgi:hypothetical protein